ncbi:uncharacterized protein [Ptychodera flava]|uniref:uncharacterized protein n=1 Tax=Ptychodera flava TaxID=63121 RepID=UPI00396A3872
MNNDSSVLQNYSAGRITDALVNIDDIASALALDAGDSLLDIGCGPGVLTKLLADRVKSVKGIDSLPGMIDQARRHNAAGNITYALADCSHPEFWDEHRGMYDKAVANYVLHWIDIKDAFFEGVYDCLRPGGKLYVNISIDTAINPITSISQHTKDPRWETYMEGYEYPFYPIKDSKDDTLVKNLKVAGFSSIECEPKTHQIFFKDKYRARANYKTFLGHSSRIPEELREEYVEDVLNFVIGKFERRDEAYVAEIELMTAVATK